MLDLATSLNGLTEKVTIWKDTLEAKDLLVNMIKAKVFCNNSKKNASRKSREYPFGFRHFDEGSNPSLL